EELRGPGGAARHVDPLQPGLLTHSAEIDLDRERRSLTHRAQHEGRAALAAAVGGLAAEHERARGPRNFWPEATLHRHKRLAFGVEAQVEGAQVHRDSCHAPDILFAEAHGVYLPELARECER